MMIKICSESCQNIDKKIKFHTFGNKVVMPSTFY